MHIEFLVEEPSAEAALQNIVPKILGEGVSFNIHPYQGKSDLLSKLARRLRGYHAWLPKDWRIVVLLDADDDECHQLKSTLETAALDVGLITKSVAMGEGKFQVLNRLAIEELEAWFFGDVDALHGAYPRISLDLANKRKYRNPDYIPGGTWEALERELRRAGYYRRPGQDWCRQGNLCTHGAGTQSIQEFPGIPSRTTGIGQLNDRSISSAGGKWVRKLR